MNTHRNNSLDMLRGIACIFVVIGHHPFPGMLGALIKSICRTSIPFFFMLSGYYTNKNDKKKTLIEIVKRIKKTVNICLVATVFSLVMEFIFFYRRQPISDFLQNYFSVDKILRLILWNDTAEISHLWYLFALLYCYFFLYVILLFFVPDNDYRIFDVVVFLLWVSLIIFSEILPICGKEIDLIYYRNAPFMGFPFFWTGFRLRTKQIEKTIDFKVVLFFGIGIIIMERLFIGNTETSLGVTLVSVVTFIEAINNPAWVGQNVLIIFARDYSLLIYILHWYVINVEYKIINELQFLNIPWYLYISPLVVLLYSTIAAIVVKKILLLAHKLFHDIQMKAA